MPLAYSVSGAIKPKCQTNKGLRAVPAALRQSSMTALSVCGHIRSILGAVQFLPEGPIYHHVPITLPS